MKHVITQADLHDTATIARCFGIFTFLRPHLDEQTFVERVRIQAAQGYRIAKVEIEGQVAAAAGYRVANFLAWGKVLYIDDLITHPEMKRLGLGSALLDWLLEQGRQSGCDEVHLDTGHQRHDAHRLYLNKGFILSSHHMSVRLK